MGETTSPAYKGKGVKFHEDLTAIMNSLGVCGFPFSFISMRRNPELSVQLWDYAPIFGAVTGVDLSREEFLRCGERIVCLEKAYNIRLGLSRKDDTLHGRWMDEPCPSGVGKGMKCADYLDGCLDEYYEEKHG